MLPKEIIYLVDTIVTAGNGGVSKAKAVSSTDISTKDLIDLTEFVGAMAGHKLTIKDNSTGYFIGMRTSSQKLFSIVTNIAIIRSRTSHTSKQRPINNASQTNELMNGVASG